MRHPPPKFSSGKIHSLDGWRALSVAAVLLAHWELPFLPDGWRAAAGIAGVRFFFVISGFLITWLLLREFSRSGRINLKAFYLRRAFRILPVYFAFLAVCALFLPFTTVKPSGGQWLASLSFAGNYADLPGHFGHLWTLAVEEQFYLVWPLAFSLSMLAKKPKALLVGLAVSCVVGPTCRAVEFLSQPDVPLPLNRFSFFLHADSLAAGCLAAILGWKQSAIWDMLARWRWQIKFAAFSAIAAATPFLSGFNGAVFLRHVAGSSFQALGFAAILLLSLSRTEGITYAVLNHRPVAAIGVLSYSIYIWHLLFAPSHTGLEFLLCQDPHWKMAVYLPLSLSCALISYHGLEKPLLGIRHKYLTHD